MQKILITGAWGMLGKELLELPFENYFIYCVNSKEFDLRNYNEVEILMQSKKPDIIIHLAAKVNGIMGNINDPLGHYQDNALINTNVIAAAVKYKVKNLIAVASTCIYPDEMPESFYPLTEDKMFLGSPAATNFYYGYAKRAMCVHIEAVKKQLGYNYCYVIPSNLYGPFDKFEDGKSHYVAALIKKIYNAVQNNEDAITLMGTGKPLRQFVYAADVAQIIANMVQQNIYENFNIANESKTIDEIARIALKACGATHLKINYDASLPDGQFRKCVSNQKLYNLFKDVHFTPLEQGIFTAYHKFCEVQKINLVV